jgi:branched-chain amino acid transport system substrate-binding protein
VENGCLDSKALTKIQPIILITVILIAAVGGYFAYFLWSGKGPAVETIKIGVCDGLDTSPYVWQAAILAAEQVNAEGGVLGRRLEIVAEDDDLGLDTVFANDALVRLITVDKADCVITPNAITIIPFQDICSQQKKILFSVRSAFNELTQRVIDDYDRYKYFFRVMNPNVTALVSFYADSLLTLREYTGFNKIALLVHDSGALPAMETELNKILLSNGFEIVFNTKVPLGTTDFSSYLARIENSGAEILYPLLAGGHVSLSNEWHERESPFVIWGNVGNAGDHDFYNLTKTRGEFISNNGWPVIAGYPLTSKTVPAGDAYLERWDENMLNSQAAAAYDIVRFILPDAILRAGTTETESLIIALENTDIETSLARHFRFTSSHDVLVNVAGSSLLSESCVVPCMFQWQNGTQVPVYPRAMMEEAGATYKYPHWQGPWGSRTEVP